MSRYVPIPNYPEIKLTVHGVELLRRAHDFDQGARSDADGKRERVYRPGKTEGNTARALVNQGVLRYASATGHRWVDGVEATAAGCAVLAALARRP